MRVTSVSRRAEALNEAAASVYVITAEDIRRSGVTSIPEALRLAPGVEVARNGSNEWTISMRGFSSDLSNKLLVLIDGRSVYSPLFAGVFWDVQDTLLEDIERIEVVAGPGGTLWGANAVNGVINIITQSAADTPGALVEAGAGNEETFAGFRYGWAASDKLDMRAYVKHFDRDESQTLAGAGAFDDWRMAQAGTALAWRATEDDLVDVRADVYEGEESALLRGDFTLGGPVPRTDIPGQVDVNGHNVLARWRRNLSAEANWRLQFYYDHTDRQIPGSFNEARDTYDFDFQHDLENPGRHDLLWGAGLRSTSDDIGNTLFATFMPPSRTDTTLSAYLQDRIELKPERLFLTLGSKFEDNDYTGFESQPSARVAWLPDRAADRVGRRIARRADSGAAQRGSAAHGAGCRARLAVAVVYPRQRQSRFRQRGARRVRARLSLPGERESHVRSRALRSSLRRFADTGGSTTRGDPGSAGILPDHGVVGQLDGR